MKKTLIIQTSPMHTASTLLVNALYGLIPSLKHKRIVGFWEPEWWNEFDSDIIVLKSHNLDIDWFKKHFGLHYKLIFICSERKEKKLFINKKYKDLENVICFDYFELNETKKNTLQKIVQTIQEKIKQKFPNLELNSKTSLLRILAMNEEYEQIKEKPFSFVDEFYHIHGSHRNRPDSLTQ